MTTLKTKNLDIVLLQPDTRLEYAATQAEKVLGRFTNGKIKIQTRHCFRAEHQDFVDSITDGNRLDVAKFYPLVRNRRQALMTPHHKASMFVTGLRLHRSSWGEGMPPFGWSVADWRTGTASAWGYNAYAHGAANPENGLIHTIVHESAHLMGLWPEGEGHCLLNNCVMSGNVNVSYLTSGHHHTELLRGNPFCKYCLIKFQRALQNSLA